MGLSVPEVAEISGHSDFRMLARYAHAVIPVTAAAFTMTPFG
jgi:hypothetical protein